MKPKRAAIFDMDGLLIDSEPLWRIAEIEVFSEVGLSLTDELCRQTVGLRADEAVGYWHARRPWPGPSVEDVTRRLLDSAEALIVERGALMPGAAELLATLHAQQMRLAIASSSPLRLIRAVVARFELSDYFGVLHTAEHEPAGKPDPAVYVTTMARLGVEPALCIAFEDSVPGVRSAKAAGAAVVAVPAPEDAGDEGFALADMRLESLHEFSLEALEAKGGQASRAFGD